MGYENLFPGPEDRRSAGGRSLPAGLGWRGLHSRSYPQPKEGGVVEPSAHLFFILKFLCLDTVALVYVLLVV